MFFKNLLLKDKCVVKYKSLVLTKTLELCSNSLVRSITRFRDIETINRKKDVIVFVTNSPDQIKGALHKSLNTRVSRATIIRDTYNTIYKLLSMTFIRSIDLKKERRSR